MNTHKKAPTVREGLIRTSNNVSLDYNLTATYYTLFLTVSYPAGMLALITLARGLS